MYQDFISRVFKVSGSIYLICFCEWKSQRLSIPSWVPDLSKQELAKSIFVHPINVSSLSRPPRISKGVLSLQGVVVSSLQRVQSHKLTKHTSRKDGLRELVWLANQFDLKQPCRYGANCVEPFIRTVNNNLFANFCAPHV